MVSHLSTRLGIPAHSPIIPLVIGPEAATMAAARQLLAQGFHVGAIRPPTVPAGTCRLRISLSAGHTLRDVDDLIEAVRRLGLTFTPLTHLMSHPPWTEEWGEEQRRLDVEEDKEMAGGCQGDGGRAVGGRGQSGGLPLTESQQQGGVVRSRL